MIKKQLYGKISSLIFRECVVHRRYLTLWYYRYFERVVQLLGYVGRNRHVNVEGDSNFPSLRYLRDIGSDEIRRVKISYSLKSFKLCSTKRWETFFFSLFLYIYNRHNSKPKLVLITNRNVLFVLKCYANRVYTIKYFLQRIESKSTQTIKFGK